jgi:hypothetical protein
MNFRHPIFSGLVFVLLVVLFFYAFHEPAKSGPDMRFMGKWTDPKGEAGNYVQFGQTWSKSSVPGVQLGEGWVVFHKLLGEEETRVPWGFGNYHPLELNVTVTGKCSFAYVRMLDDDHMLVRFTPTLVVPRTDDLFDHAETRLMTRVREGE